MKNVITYLRYLRKRKGMSQEKLAQSIGLSLRHVSRWETGEGGSDSKINSEALLRAVVVLNADFEKIEQLLARDDMTTEQVERLAVSQNTLRENGEAYQPPMNAYAAEAQRRVEWLYARSPALAKQFLDYGQFLEEHLD